MPNSLANDYESLIKYLETEKAKSSSFKKVEPKQPKKSDVKQEDAAKKTKQLLEECSENIHADIPLTKAVQNSKGFDVFKFESLMRSKLVDGHKRSQSYERPYISVTELCSCIRKSYYIRMKYPINVEDQYQFSYLYLINEVGNTVHEAIQNLYDHTEVEKTILSEKYKVKGRVDGIRDRFLLEYKTIERAKFKGKYIEAHYIQGNIYAYILNTEYNYDIDTITIVYIMRDLKKVVPFDLPLDIKGAESYLRRAPIILDSVSSKRAPDPIGSDEEQCKYCLYKKYCEEDKTDMIQPFNKKDKKKKKKSVFLLS